MLRLAHSVLLEMYGSSFASTSSMSPKTASITLNGDEWVCIHVFAPLPKPSRLSGNSSTAWGRTNWWNHPTFIAAGSNATTIRAPSRTSRRTAAADLW